MVSLEYINKDERDNVRSTVDKKRKMREGQPLKFKRYANAIILPYKDPTRQLGGIVTSEGEFVDDSGHFEERSVGIYEFDCNNAICDTRTVIYIGMLISLWGHAITDDIKKLWWINTRSVQYDAIVYIADWETKIPSHIKIIFSKLGIDIDKCEQITYVTRFSNVIVPENSFIHHHKEKYYTDEYSNTILQIKNNIKCDKTFPAKLYFTRSRLQQDWLRDYGERSIERVFKKMGFTIISPELLSIDEQIKALSLCKHFATTEGSIAHSSVFCSKNAKITLIRKVNVINQWQLPINDMIGFDVTYVDAHYSVCSNKIHPMIGPFYLCITRELERYVGHRILHFPLWFRPSWYRYRYQLQNKWWYRKGVRVWERLTKLIK